MSVQAGGMRRNDSTCIAQVFPSNTHIVLPVAQKLVCFLFFSDSRSHILIKTNPQYTIFELIKTSLSLVPFHSLPHLHLAGGGRGAYQLIGHMTKTLQHGLSLLSDSQLSHKQISHFMEFGVG